MSTSTIAADDDAILPILPPQAQAQPDPPSQEPFTFQLIEPPVPSFPPRPPLTDTQKKMDVEKLFEEIGPSVQQLVILVGSSSRVGTVLLEMISATPGNHFTLGLQRYHPVDPPKTGDNVAIIKSTVDDWPATCSNVMKSLHPNTKVTYVNLLDAFSVSDVIAMEQSLRDAIQKVKLMDKWVFIFPKKSFVGSTLAGAYGADDLGTRDEHSEQVLLSLPPRGKLLVIKSDIILGLKGTSENVSGFNFDTVYNTILAKFLVKKSTVNNIAHLVMSTWNFEAGQNVKTVSLQDLPSRPGILRTILHGHSG